MLELHVYGPGFGLPSIEPSCLAAIALLQRCAQSGQLEWKLIPSNDLNVSPFDELPALRNDGLWVAGFRDIAHYIRTQYQDTIEHEASIFDLDETQSANNEAYLAFLESRGLPILDLSLYVSSDNYTTSTRPTLSTLLPWPQSWHIPQQLRDRARKRSEHLGLSGLDVDASHEKELKKENEGISAAIPKSLRLPKKSVSALLGSRAEATRFRLEAVTNDFFEPLNKLLGEQDCFLGETMTVLDCYALSVLALMDVGDMAQPWLREALHKYPRLSNWTAKHVHSTFGASANLPWETPTERSWYRFGFDVLNSIAESLPLTLTTTAIRPCDNEIATSGRSGQLKKLESKHSFRMQIQRHQQVLRETVTAGVSSAGLLGTLIYMGVLTSTLR